jgi:hypothetical protein
MHYFAITQEKTARVKGFAQRKATSKERNAGVACFKWNCLENWILRFNNRFPSRLSSCGDVQIHVHAAHLSGLNPSVRCRAAAASANSAGAALIMENSRANLIALERRLAGHWLV